MSKIKSIFELPEFKPYEKVWNIRIKTLTTRAKYYDGSIYDDAINGLSWLAPRIGQSIEPPAVDNPAPEVYVSEEYEQALLAWNAVRGEEQSWESELFRKMLEAWRKVRG